jgi:hypothetical protein
MRILGCDQHSSERLSSVRRYEVLTSAISLGFIAWLDLGLAVSLRHDVLVLLAAGVLHQLRVGWNTRGIVNVHGRT